MATTATTDRPDSSSSERRPPSPAKPTFPRLAFLDGMRGLTAFYVLVHHVYSHIMSHHPPQLRGAAAYLSRWLEDGGMAVSIFIVVSGYCLMLPSAHDTPRSLAPGRFLRRRAIRILPPYYAALALSLLFIATVPIMQPRTNSPWDNAVPAFTPGRLISHLLLVHNAGGDWLFAIDPPMWSIAVEWQIYFVFLFLLHPLWRRFGITPTVTIAFVIGLVPAALNGPFHPNSWYIGLFAFGMLGAIVTVSSKAPLPDSLAVRLPNVDECAWVWVSLLILIIVTPSGNDLLGGGTTTDVLLGILTAVTIVALAQEAQQGAQARRSLLLRALESPVVVELGAFSYSLYLVHFPVVSFCDRVLSLYVHGYRFPIAMFAVGVSLSLGISYLFHLAFERPFMHRQVHRT